MSKDIKANITLITSALIFVLISGCVSGRHIEHNKINSIQKGITTESQITKMFGEQTQVYINSGSNTKKIVYLYATDNGLSRQVAGTTGSMAVSQIAVAVHPILGALGSIAGSTVGNSVVAPIGEKQQLEISVV